jgi:hypothetical protein
MCSRLVLVQLDHISYASLVKSCNVLEGWNAAAAAAAANQMQSAAQRNLL